jgi:glucosamine-6-phosphate deaminase
MENQHNTRDKMPIIIVDNEEDGAKKMASVIADTIKNKQAKNENPVLGLATGSSPILIYKELIRLHQEEGLSFKNVITFNLDEYFPMSPDTIHSYYQFMFENLFDHVDINKDNIHIPDGNIEISEVNQHCADYEKEIEAAGGIDIQLLGIGRTGHIGFNEPGSSSDSTTRLVELHPITIADAAGDFGTEGAIPQRAITMGIKTILNSRKIILAAWGKWKAPILQKMVEEPISPEVPASYLQTHNDISIFADKEAAKDILS